MAVTAGTGTLVATAGCSGDDGDGDTGSSGSGSDGSGSDTGSDGTPGGDAPSTWYSRRLPAPAELGLDHYRFQYTDVPELLANVDQTGIQPPAEDAFPGLELSSLDHVLLAIPPGTAGPSLTRLEGSFDPADFIDQVSNAQGLSEVGTAGSFTLWGSDSTDRYAVGVKQGAIVQASAQNGGATDAVRTAIDAGAGEATLYAAADPPLAELVAVLGTPTTVAARRHDPADGLEGAVGSGAALDLGDDESTIQGAMAFESADAAATGACADWLASTWAFGDGAAPESVGDGNVVAADTSMATGDVEEATLALARDQPQQGTVPQVAFEWEFEPADGDTGRLTITHTSGEHVRADRLRVAGSGFADVSDTDQTSAGSWAGSASGDQDGNPAVVAGDRVTLGVTSDYEIELIWDGPDGSVVLDDQSGPAA